MKTQKPRQPTDLTLRNNNARKAEITQLRQQVKDLTKRVRKLERRPR